MKIRINEDTNSIREVIAQKLPDLDLDWELTEYTEKDEKNKTIKKKQFSTEIGDFKIVVKENEVLLHFVNENDSEGLTEEVKVLTDSAKKSNGKPIKSSLHCKLCTRFEAHNEITYYKRILEAIQLKEAQDEDELNNDNNEDNRML